MGSKWSRVGVFEVRGAGLGSKGSRFGVFGDLGGKFRVFLGCMGEERLGSKGNRFGVFGV